MESNISYSRQNSNNPHPYRRQKSRSSIESICNSSGTNYLSTFSKSNRESFRKSLYIKQNKFLTLYSDEFSDIN